MSMKYFPLKINLGLKKSKKGPACLSSVREWHRAILLLQLSDLWVLQGGRKGEGNTE